jgi:CheY-like chemotaxis protein
MMAFSYARLRIGRRQRLSLRTAPACSFLCQAGNLWLCATYSCKSPAISIVRYPPISFFESPAMSANASTILVVEDDAIVRMLIVDVLEELEYAVLEAEDGDKALEILAAPDQPIDLMMTDHGLPGMDGRELAKRARELRPTLPILFASGYAESIDVPKGMHMIGKPFSIDQLRDKVKSILE